MFFKNKLYYRTYRILSNGTRHNLFVLGLFCFCLTVYGKTISYTEDTSDFPNPERGLSSGTVQRQYIYLENYRNSDLDSYILDKIENTLNNVRENRKKLILRFAYVKRGSDAPKEQVLRHLSQLKPIFRKHYDVIPYVEAGLVGHFGEWHNSTYIKTEEDIKEIVFALLDALPKERMIVLRYNVYKRSFFDNNEPLTEAEAFSGSNRARIGAHNDCFITNESNTGTYSDLNGRNGWGLGVEAERRYLSLDNLYVPQGGETCTAGYDPEYSTCEKAVNDFREMRWDFFRIDWPESVINRWKDQGCFDEISRNMGYRITLRQSTISNETIEGKINLNLQLENIGYGKMYNPRKLELVLVSEDRKKEYAIPLDSDPRFWSPGLRKDLNLTIHVPDSVPLGTYSLHLSLQDPAPALYGIPKYAIRMANAGLWDAEKGYNSLNHDVIVSSHSDGTGLSNFNVRMLASNDVSWDLEISGSLVQGTDPLIRLYDMSGKVAAQLQPGKDKIKQNKMNWSGIIPVSKNLPAGMYFIQFQAGRFSETKKVVISDGFRLK